MGGADIRMFLVMVILLAAGGAASAQHLQASPAQPCVCMGYADRGVARHPSQAWLHSITLRVAGVIVAAH